jgi:hypothetical protein
MSWWLIILAVGAALLIILTVLGWFLRDELRGGWDAVWLVWCWIYAMRWRVRFRLQGIVGQTAAGVLLTGSFFIFLELAISALHYVSGREHESDGFLAQFLPSVELPDWGDAVLVLLAVLVLKHHWHEWKLRKREAAVPAGLTKLIVDTRSFLRLVHPAEDQRAEFFEKTMRVITEVLTVGREKRRFNISMMTVDVNKKELVITHAYPAHNQTYVGQQLALERSAAGTAYGRGVPIYVPSTRHLAGINMKTYRSVGLVFAEGPTVDSGPSLMCIPVLTEQGNIVAILNVSCDAQNAFSPIDFDISGVAAALFASFY